ncbi:sigma-70 family RNA polymerase sigma factor [Salinicoccus luteus]|uniref:sigma-70 family RNA polymerase sigma factor n=1 Tax=Salinicoccus luteus TaxID=367840 RepID=UPI000AFF223E|nr:sigma-70 family RNA polymerase sigma factor [Salinicoccus luteus]
MDVSGSSKANDTLFDRLKWMEEEITSWLSGQNFFHVDYRMGDELFILSSRAHYTLFVAIYAKLLWDNHGFPLKCSFHTADIPAPEGDPEQWSHEAVKETRNALETIKKSAVQDFISPDMDPPVEIALMYATDILDHMTDIQHQVASLKLGGMLQKDISSLLGKNESTISAHYSKSRGRQLEKILEFLSDHYQVDDTPLRSAFSRSFRKGLES